MRRKCSSSSRAEVQVAWLVERAKFRHIFSPFSTRIFGLDFRTFILCFKGPFLRSQAQALAQRTSGATAYRGIFHTLHQHNTTLSLDLRLSHPILGGQRFEHNLRPCGDTRDPSCSSNIKAAAAVVGRRIPLKSPSQRLATTARCTTHELILTRPLPLNLRLYPLRRALPLSSFPMLDRRLHQMVGHPPHPHRQP